MKSWSFTMSIVNVFFVPRSDVRFSLIGMSVGPGAERARDRRGAILRDRADDLAGARDLRRAQQARQHDVHVGARHRELRRAQAIERMTERVDAIAVDLGDRAGGAELQVAAHQRDADRIARAQRLFAAAVAAAGACGANAPAMHRHEALIAEGGDERIRERRRRSRRASAAWRSAAASSRCPAFMPASPSTCTSPGLSANGRIQANACRSERAQPFRRERHLQLDARELPSRRGERRRFASSRRSA